MREAGGAVLLVVAQQRLRVEQGSAACVSHQAEAGYREPQSTIPCSEPDAHRHPEASRLGRMHVQIRNRRAFAGQL